jgi:hypothetical protein
MSRAMIHEMAARARSTDLLALVTKTRASFDVRSSNDS